MNLKNIIVICSHDLHSDSDNTLTGGNFFLNQISQN
jgi:hypothetical protein